MTTMKSAILFHPEWSFSHLCEVPLGDGSDDTPVPFVMHGGELFVRDDLKDQFDRQGRVHAYEYTPVHIVP